MLGTLKNHACNPEKNSKRGTVLTDNENFSLNSLFSNSVVSADGLPLQNVLFACFD